MTDITVPELGESVTEATVGRWLRAAGDQIDRDDILVELETDKVAVEVPAPETGILAEIVSLEGQTVQIGALLGRIRQSDAVTAPKASGVSPDPGDGKPSSSAALADQTAIAPSVRRIAAEAGIDAASITGSGRDGRATKADALDHVAQSVTKPTDDTARASSVRSDAAGMPARPNSGPTGDRREERVRMSRLRQTIARRLKEAQNTAAMLSTFNDVDMSRVMNMRKTWRDTFVAVHGVKLGFMGFFTRACIDALSKFPAVNARIDGDDIVYHQYYDISIAVGTDRGLVTPVVRNADKLDLAGIEREIARLGTLARDGQIQLDDIRGGTFTITNGGVYGSMLSTPIVNPPQSAVLGIHRIEERPIAVNGEITIRPMMYLALSYDHRIIDGKEAVSFLVAIKDSMENPERMLLGL